MRAGRRDRLGGLDQSEVAERLRAVTDLAAAAVDVVLSRTSPRSTADWATCLLVAGYLAGPYLVGAVAG
jgi:hypothetical protein